MRKAVGTSRSKPKPRSKQRRNAKSKVVQNRYEDAWWDFGSRSWLPGTVQDARLDADASTRLELIRKARYWSRNSPISIDCGDIFAQHVVGVNGVQMVPSFAGQGGQITKDAENWDEAASGWWSRWAKSPCADSDMSLAAWQNQAAHSWWHDGELFVYKTYDRRTGEPRIQSVEAHRISTPPNMRAEEGRSIVDGIEFVPDQDGRPSGKPVRYWLRVDASAPGAWGSWVPSLWGSANFRPIPASQMLHLADPDRPGMAHALPKATGRMNTLHDVEDLWLMEKKAARDAAEITNIVTNKTGEASAGPMRRQKWQIQSQDANGNPVVKPNPLYYEVTLGGRTIYMMNGEKIEQFKSERPTVTTIEFWNYMIRMIAGPMWVLMLPQQVQGTQLRGFFEVVNTYFRTHTAVLANVMEDIYTWALGWGVNYDRALDGAPDEWWHVEAIPPKSIIVDLGRDSTARLNSIKAGTWTYKDECGERGHHWMKVLRQKAIEAAFINRLVDEYNVTGRQIAELAQESLRVTEKVAETAAEVEEENPDGGGGDRTLGAQPITVNVKNQMAKAGSKRTYKILRDEHGRPDKLELTEEVKT